MPGPGVFPNRNLPPLHVYDPVTLHEYAPQALEAWLEESARQDEDAMTLAKYARADESKIKVILVGGGGRQRHWD